jgi:REP element-mobilizing transposase RayT
MRYTFGALPWELLGRRPAFITQTYPGQWRAWCPDARTLVRHREAFKEAWRKAFGAPVGVWVVEFQTRSAPHIHLYVGLPEALSDSEFNGYVKRTLYRRRLERELGDTFKARASVRAPEGEFADWLLTTWWKIVGSGDRYHRYRGVDIAAVNLSEKGKATPREKVADYFWRESGKFSQKAAPEGFGSLRFYGVWGKKVGFVPMETTHEVSKRVYVVLRRLYRRCLEARERARRGKRWRWQGRGLDGITLYDVRDAPVLARRAEQWAEDEALRRGAGTDGAA